MRRLILPLVLALGSFATAAPATSPQGIGQLYTREADGTMVFTCSGALVEDAALPASGKVFLTAAHCVDWNMDDSDDDGTVNPMYVTFDDGLSFTRVGGMITASTRAGYDVAILVARFEQEFPKGLRAYKLSRTKLKTGDDIETWGFPAGAGLTYTKGYVRIASIDRAYKTENINWVGAIAAELNTAGGASGSAVFNMKGEVVGILMGTYADNRGFQLTAIFPIIKILP